MKPAPLLRIVPPLWFFFFLVIGLLLHFLVPATHVFNFSYSLPGAIIGGIIFIAGWAITLRASALFKIENTEILPTSPANRALVTYGPFRFSRNPMYLGMIMNLLGIAVYLGTLPMFISALAHFMVLNFFFIPFEEEKMARQFGEQYAAYRRTVRRWL